MDRAEATEIVDRLHAAQNEFYGGGDDGPLRVLLGPDIRWTVPGSSPLAGTYHSVKEAFAYFADRRDRVAGTFQMHRGDVLAGDRSTRRVRRNLVRLIAASTTAALRGSAPATGTAAKLKHP